jgi:hypothetical protein
MVMDAQITVTIETIPAAAADQAVETIEPLYPDRHLITLPLNSLNNYFYHSEIAFNYHTKLDCDRNYFLDFDAWGHMSAVEQNFNPSLTDIQRRIAYGKNNNNN